MTNHDNEFQNEKEWRRYLIKRIDSLEEKLETKMNGTDNKISSLEKRVRKTEILGETLKVKVGIAAAIFGAAAGMAVTFIKNFIHPS